MYCLYAQSVDCNMFKSNITLLTLMMVIICIGQCCLITNCPKGGKRNGRFHHESNIKQCLSCGPEGSGQCFGPNICCGPFGCLIGTVESVKCQQDGLFDEPEPCMAGFKNCGKNTGRCAIEGVCCRQDACRYDSSCVLDEKSGMNNQRIPLDSLYNVYRISNQMEYGNELNSV